MNSSENKNLVLAMVLMLAVWLGFSILFPPNKQSVQPVDNSQSKAVVSSEAKVQPAPEVKAVAVSEVAAFDQASTPVAETTAPAREIVVETDKYQAIFTTQGARLISFKLKDYLATADADALPVQIFEPGPLRYSTLRTTGSEGFVLNEDARFETTAEGLVTVNGSDQAVLRFQHVAANGVQYVKTFLVRGDGYLIDAGLELHNASTTPLRGTINLALVQRWDESLEADMYSFSGPATLVKDEIEEVDVDDLEEGSVAYSKDVAWTSFQTKYFLSVVVPGERTVERVQILRNGDAIENVLETAYFTLQGGERRQLDYLVFVGPKEPHQLKAAGHQLDKVVNFGFFNLLAQPLFVVLTFFYGYFKNYGVAIILLTVLIKQGNDDAVQDPQR
jgi:YidC/Oxa1 family membrane protein insertase